MDISIGHSLWPAIDSLQAKTNQYHVQAAKDKILCRLIFLPLNDKTPDILDAVRQIAMRWIVHAVDGLQRCSFHRKG